MRFAESRHRHMGPVSVTFLFSTRLNFSKLSVGQLRMSKHMDLRYQIERTHDVVVVRCSGRMVCGQALDEFRRQIEQFEHVRIVVLNLSGVDQLDAGGVGLLLQLRRWARKNSARLNLVNPSPAVRELLAATHLTSVFEITSLEEALCILQAPPPRPALRGCLISRLADADAL